jgi:exonuclease III
MNSETDDDKQTNEIKIGYINIRGITGSVEAVKEGMDRLGMQYMGLVETWMRRGDGCPFRGVVAESRCEEQETVMNAGSGRRGSKGVMMIRIEKEVRERVLEEDAKGRWIVVELGDVIVITAYLRPAATETDLQEFVAMRDKHARNAVDRPMVVMGDFNARYAAATGDSASTSDRGRLK